MLIAVMMALSSAPDYLTTVQSEVFQAEGSPAQITARAEQCIAEQLGSGIQGGELIVSRDPAAGVIVARNAVSYQDGLMNWRLRSRVTFEAREGRFRIVHNAIERFNDQGGGWSPVGKWRFSGWQKAENALKATSDSLAGCVIGSGPAVREDW